MHNDLAFQDVAKLLKCAPETGRLFWLSRSPDMFLNGARTAEHNCNAWNARYAGTEAFTALDRYGYRVGFIFHRIYRAHRIVWLLTKGAWPSDEIDHMNGIRSDNRISNLRAVSHAENGKNARLPSHNKSGVVGVRWNKSHGKWCVSIKVGGKDRHLGFFDEFEAAVARRKAAEIEAGFHPNHGRAA